MRDSYTHRMPCPSHEMWSYERDGRWWGWSFVRGSTVLLFLCYNNEDWYFDVRNFSYTVVPATRGHCRFGAKVSPRGRDRHFYTHIYAHTSIAHIVYALVMHTQTMSESNENRETPITCITTCSMCTLHGINRHNYIYNCVQMQW